MLAELRDGPCLELAVDEQIDSLVVEGNKPRDLLALRQWRAVPPGEVSHQAVSQHLKVLKEAGLVIDRQEGTRRVYQLNPEGVGALRAYFDRFWNRALIAFKQAVEQRQEEEQ